MIRSLRKFLQKFDKEVLSKGAGKAPRQYDSEEKPKETKDVYNMDQKLDFKGRT